MASVDQLFLRGRTPFITNLDLMKSMALVIMVIDHLGLFFFPDIPLFRAIGRAGIPIWFFLSGYHHAKRSPDPYLLGAACILALVYGLYGIILPLNVLFTMLLIHVQTILFQRIVQPRWVHLSTMEQGFWLGLYVLGCTALIGSTQILLQYGTLGLMLGLWGMFQRNPTLLGKPLLYALIGIICIINISTQIIVSHFTGLNILVCVIGMVSFTIWVARYTPRIYEGKHSLLMRLGGRYTLEFYVFHLILFLIIAMTV